MFWCGFGARADASRLEFLKYMGFVAIDTAFTPQTRDSSPVSASTTPAIDIGYANNLTIALKQLGWSVGVAGGPIRGMHAYGYSRDEQNAIDLYV